MNFKVTVPDNFFAERQYIANVMLKEFLGLDYDIEQVADAKTVKISNNENTREITFPDVFFSMDESDWLKERSLPKEPLKIINSSVFPGNPILSSDRIPLIYGTNESEVSVSEEEISIPVDVFGSAFFMLTRYEEAVKNNRDTHDRFPASASLAFKEHFLCRPIINEYVEILWSSMRVLWPEIERKERKFEMVLSHDVDRPFKYRNMLPATFLKIVAADLIRRRSVRKAYESVKSYIAVKMGEIDRDPFNTFDFIMDLSEKAGLKSCFYFISDHSDNKINCDYSINDPEMISLMKKIHSRGHEIGLHPGYDTSDNPEKLKNEFVKLRKICSANGIKQEKWGSRQHYLRFSVPQTWRYLSEAGIDYDSSIGFADHVGFRSGICYDYPVYDVVQRKPLEIVEKPLVVMEKTVIDGNYMNTVSADRTINLIKELAGVTELFKGSFILLWHNSRLSEKKEIELYSRIIKNIF
ncbi:MAG TPA: polysaccharide deacetylase family protein [bacterium]|jgi:hypothetical protein|nr:polysaccharide deacetylase family protein [bacterium]HPM45809.1 polysaccharide deacetylase family protein [bacterium]HRQ70053.1 polysaccharide deacetylase family protein [bacterium]